MELPPSPVVIVPRGIMRPLRQGKHAMIDRTQIREHMEVVADDGTNVGRVDKLEGEQIKLERKGSSDGQHHYVPLSWVSAVGERVHLNRSAAAVLEATGTGAAASGIHRPTGAAAIVGSTGAGRPNWLPWAIGGAALLALILVLSQCHKTDDGVATTDTSATAQQEEIIPPRVAGAPLAGGSLAFELDRFLSGKDGTPRTFTFDKLNFDSGKASIRGADNADLDDIARVLAAYPGSRAAVVGYTDAKGDAVNNRELGGERAKSVIAALAARGVDPDRLEARTGGENDPAASNANAGGRFENRRSELIILKR